MKKTCSLCLLSAMLVLGLAACGRGGVRNGDGTYDGSYDNGTYDGTYYGSGDSLMQDAGDALENGVNDVRNGMERAGEAITGTVTGSGTGSSGQYRNYGNTAR